MTNQLPYPGHTPQPQESSCPSQQQQSIPNHAENLQHDEHADHRGRGGHGLLMIACCFPMLIIVGILVATGAAGSGAILYAVLCAAMMALMMFVMPGGHRH